MDPSAAALSVVWIGDATVADRYVTRRAPHVRITSGPAAQVADVVRQAADQQPPPDVLVIDATAPGVDPVRIVEHVKHGGLDLPVVLVVPPSGKDDLILQVSQLSVCDCVVKTEDYVYQMLPAFAQVRARHDLQAVFGALRESEESLRHVLEMQPAVVFTLDADARVAAMNLAGLTLLSAGREQVVGRQFTSFVPAEEQEAVANLVARVCAGEAGELDHSLTMAEGEPRRVRTQLVGLPRGTGTVALATLALVSQQTSEDFTGEAARLAEAIAAAEAERERLRSESDERAQIIGALDNRIRELENELSRYAHAHQQLEHDRNASVGAAEGLRAESLERAALIELLEHRVYEAAQREHALCQEFANEREQTLAEFANRERAIADQAGERERLLTEAFAAKERNLDEEIAARIRSRDEELNARGADSASALPELESLRDRLYSELAEAQAAASRLEAECARLSNELADAGNHTQTVLARTENERMALAEREQGLRAELAESERALLHEMAERERSLTDVFAAKERTLDEEFAARQSMRDDAVHARERELIEASAAKEHVLNDALRQAEAQHSESIAAVRELESQRERMSAQLAESQSVSSRLEAECARLSEDLDAARGHVATLLANSENDKSALAEREHMLRAEFAESERALWDDIAERERSLAEAFAAKERCLAAERDSATAALVEQEQRLRAEFMESERALAEGVALRERSMTEDFSARERALNDELAAARARYDASTSRNESSVEEDRRDLFELRELLIEVLFEADQRYRMPRSHRAAAPADGDETRRQSFLSFPTKIRLRPSAGSRDR